MHCVADPYTMPGSNNGPIRTFMWNFPSGASAVGSVSASASEVASTKNPPSVPDLLITVETEGAVPKLTTTSTAGPGNRSVPGFAELGSDAVAIIAEIVLERAKQQGLKVLAEQVEDMLCRKLTWGAVDPKGTIPVPNDEVFLPNLCRLASHMRLDELAATARAVAPALVADGAVVSGHVLTATLSPDARWYVQRVLGLLQKLAAGEAVDKDAQVLLLDLANLAATTTAGDTAAPWRRALHLAFTTLADCQQEVSCTTAVLSRLHAQVDGELKNTGADVVRVIWNSPGFLGAIARIDSVLRPPAGKSSVDQLKDALTASFDLLEPLACKNVESCTVFRDVRAIVDAVLQRDLGAALVATAALGDRCLAKFADVTCTQNQASCEVDKQLAQKTRVALRRVTRITVALASYAATYEGDAKDPEKKKAVHDARKKAIESLVDSETDRSGRAGSIVSIGASAALQATLEWRRSEGTGPVISPRLTLPLGITYQYFVPKAATSDYFGPAGLHLQATVLDLGQYVAYSAHGDENVANKPRIDTALAFGAQIAFILGRSSAPFLLGLDVRYSPTLYASVDSANGAAPKGVYSAGLFAGYYVPLFDF